MSTFKESIRNMSPASFALVMATGIVASAARAQQAPALGHLLFLLNNGIYVLLLLLLLARALFFGEAVLQDLSSPEKGASFLTLPAATCILGTGYLQSGVAGPGAAILWIAGIATWLLTYAFLAAVILKREKPSPQAGLSGNWLLLAVATQAVALLGALLCASGAPSTVGVIALCFFCSGVFLYLLLLALILYRLCFFPVSPEDVKPPYWITMGAAAIASIAALQLGQALAVQPALAGFLPLLRFLSLLFWAAGTFWIPVVMILELWRLAKTRHIRYKAENWSMVFPLGTYSVASGKLGSALHLPFLAVIATIFFYVAAAAWAFTLLLLLVHQASIITKKQPQP